MNIKYIFTLDFNIIREIHALNNVRYELVRLDLNPFNYNQLESNSDALVSHLNHKKSFIKLLFIFFYTHLSPTVSRGKVRFGENFCKAMPFC